MDVGFMNVKRGDKVTRLLAEKVPMELTVVRVDESLIWATSDGWVDKNPDEEPGNFWTFDRATGVEEDDDLGWGVARGVTGSRLVGFERVAPRSAE